MTISMRKTATNWSNKANKLGTFCGVFTPGILTIPGIILFCASAMSWEAPDREGAVK